MRKHRGYLYHKQSYGSAVGLFERNRDTEGGFCLYCHTDGCINDSTNPKFLPLFSQQYRCATAFYFM